MKLNSKLLPIWHGQQLLGSWKPGTLSWRRCTSESLYSRSEGRNATPYVHEYETRLWALTRHASGMVKAYLRYELSKSFGVVTSGSALDADRSGKLAIAAANENVALWNLRQGTLVSESLHRSNLLA